MKRMIYFIIIMLGLAACQVVNLEEPVPVFDTGIDPDTWVSIPAGPFLLGQAEKDASIGYDYEMMVTNVTASQYAEFLNAALADGSITLVDDKIVGYYPGDVFHEAKHEVRIDAGDWLYIPLGDPSLRLDFDGSTFTPENGYENHPMTTVTWFGSLGYCSYYGYRLPTEMEWEKAARGTDNRPYPWGEEISGEYANFYSSDDPFENMSSVGSRTTPIGFYNGRTYTGYATQDNASPYGIYDMAGNVWQWTGDVYENQHYRYMRGGSKDNYDSELRVWVRNNATPTYFSPGVGFRCVR